MIGDILAICPGHNSSITVISDNQVKLYIEEERLSRVKYDSEADSVIEYAVKNFNIEHVAMVGTSSHVTDFEGRILKRFEFFNNKKNKKKVFPSNLNHSYKVYFFGYDHHLTHAACAYYNSGFKECLAIIVDGAGTTRQYDLGDNNSIYAAQTESIYVCKYPHALQKWIEFAGTNSFHGSNLNDKFMQQEVLTSQDTYCSITDDCGIVKCYEGITDYLGFHFIEAGKTMGLSSYGKPNEKFSNLLINGRGNKNFFRQIYPRGSFVVDKFALEHRANKEWHTDPSLVTQEMKDLSYEMQIQSQQAVLNLIEKQIKETDVKNIVLAGGYGLNCVANYFYKKNLDKDVNLYVEPISHDGGTSIGAAKLVWHFLNSELNHEDRIVPDFKQNSIYYGIEYNQSDIAQEITKNKNFELVDIDYKKVVDLLLDQEIVCIFQGRSEGGPRALGNRSILFDPRVGDGKDIVNQVKKREWFRPFAGSVLEEKAGEWFDMAGLKSSPFMMYAVDVLPDKIEKIPSVTHVDNTCRVQTVNQDQNLHFYNLIKEFDDRTGVPILFNTSFNLAGEPLVEDINDALSTLERSDLKYLYLPELGKLAIKTSSEEENL